MRADDSGGQREQRPVNVEPALEANAQFAEASKPSVIPLHHPAMVAQALAAFNTSFGYPASDAVAAWMGPASCEVIALVCMRLRWPAALPASKPFDGRECIYALLEHERVVSVCTAEQHRQWNASGV